MNIFVGNLTFEVTEKELKKAFEAFGKVVSATIITDKFSGRSRGFGFVEMSNKDEAQAAIIGLNGKEFEGRALSVNEARPRSDDRRSGGRSTGFRPNSSSYESRRGKQRPDRRRREARRGTKRRGF